jgi:hypothetical protein
VKLRREEVLDLARAFGSWEALDDVLSGRFNLGEARLARLEENCACCEEEEGFVLDGL